MLSVELPYYQFPDEIVWRERSEPAFHVYDSSKAHQMHHPFVVVACHQLGERVSCPSQLQILLDETDLMAGKHRNCRESLHVIVSWDVFDCFIEQLQSLALVIDRLARSLNGVHRF